jgi:hypothetical protein
MASWSTTLQMSLNRYKPTPRECVLLFLSLVRERQDRRGKSTSRARLSEITLKRLWNREVLSRPFLDEVQEWFLTAGWTLIYAGSTYAAIKVDSILDWPRHSAKRLAGELNLVAQGIYDFAELEKRLLAAPDSDVRNRDIEEPSSDETSED